MVTESAYTQTTSTLLMIRPCAFTANEQTMSSNAFQKPDEEEEEVEKKALSEFDTFVHVLRAEGIQIIVVDDTLEPRTPDSIFPNNWVSFHDNGSIFLYPMQAENRRLERRTDILEVLKTKGFIEKRIEDLSYFENQHKYLEGTGSMVLDRTNRLAYACLSPRTNQEVLAEFCIKSGYRNVLFQAVDSGGKAIYHTNVMMCVATHFNLVCLESVKNEQEKAMLLEELYLTGKDLITISPDQMNHFAGNMLEVRNDRNEPLLIMSSQAYQSLSDEQRTSLNHHCKIIHSPLDTIEKNGGGSARCMLAEIHLPWSNPGTAPK